MDIKTKKPAAPSGYFKRDIARLYDFCRKILQDVKHALNNIEDKQIKSVSVSKLTTGELEISGAKIILSDGAEPLKIVAPEGDQCVIIIDKQLNITCNELRANAITAGTYNNLPAPEQEV